MADPQNQDWFATNAPPPSARQLTPAAQDWFASNAPKAQPDNMPSADWISAHYGRYGDTSPQQAVERYKNRSFVDKAIDFIQKPADVFTGHSEAAIDAAKSGQYAKSGNEAFKAAAPIALAAVPGQLAVRPLMTARAIAGGYLASKATEVAATGAGASPDQAELAGNVGGIAGGTVAGTGLIRAFLESPTKALLGKLAPAADSPAADVAGLVEPRIYHMLRLLRVANKVAGAGTSEDTAGLADIVTKHKEAISALESQLNDALSKANALPPEGPTATFKDVPNLRVQPSQQAPQNLLAKPAVAQTAAQPQGGTFQVVPPEGAVTPSGRVTPDMEIYKEPAVAPAKLKPPTLLEQLRQWDQIRQIHDALEKQIGEGQDEVQQWMKDHDQQAPGAKPQSASDVMKAKFNAARAAAESKANAIPGDEGQGGHAGGGVISAEEAARPGQNFIVNKSAQLTAHGKQFAPESTPAGSSHVTALPDGTIRVNAGPKLNAAQESAVMNAVKKQPFTGTPKVPASDTEMENILMEMVRQMKSNKARSAKAGDD